MGSGFSRAGLIQQLSSKYGDRHCCNEPSRDGVAVRSSPLIGETGRRSSTYGSVWRRKPVDFRADPPLAQEDFPSVVI
jgi:hypothetical protein